VSSPSDCTCLPAQRAAEKFAKKVLGENDVEAVLQDLEPTHHGGITDDCSTDHGGRTRSICQHESGHGWYVNILSKLEV